MLPSAYRVNVSAAFPVQVVGAEGVEVSKANGIYTIGSAYETLVPLGGVLVLSQKLVKVLDSVSGIYNTVPLSVLPGGSIFPGVFGYASGVGAGGAVTGAAGSVMTLNKASGTITIVSQAFTGLTWYNFSINNNLVAAFDTIVITELSGSLPYVISVVGVNAGSGFNVWFQPILSATDSPKFQFNIIRGANS